VPAEAWYTLCGSSRPRLLTSRAEATSVSGYRAGITAVALLLALASAPLAVAQTITRPADQGGAGASQVSGPAQAGALPQPAPPTLTVSPSAAVAMSATWTLHLSAPYCGGFRIGQGVAVQPRPPLTLEMLTARGVRFDQLAAETEVVGDVLWVRPAPGQIWSMICLQQEQPFTIDFTGVANPPAGTYTVTVWSGAHPDPISLAVTPVEVAPSP